jgi:hypothetical protein
MASKTELTPLKKQQLLLDALSGKVQRDAKSLRTHIFRKRSIDLPIEDIYYLLDVLESMALVSKRSSKQYEGELWSTTDDGERHFRDLLQELGPLG